MSHHSTLWWAGTAFLLVLLLAGTTPAEELRVVEEETREAGFAIDGFRIELGAALPVHAEIAPLVGATLNTGTFGLPWIDATLGARWWSSDIDRSSFDSSDEGSLTDLGIRAGLSTHLPAVRGARPYLTAGLAGHWISADIPGDRSLQDALEGVRLGADLGIGLASTRDGIGWRAELRRDFVEDAGHWGLAMGFGWWPTTSAQRPRQDPDYPAPATTTVVPVPAQRAPLATQPDAAPDPGLQRDLTQLKRQNQRLAARLDSLALARRAAATTPPPAAEPAPKRPATPPAPELGDTLRQMARLGGGTVLLETGNGFTLRLSGEALFDSGSALVQPAAREELRRLALVLLRHPDARAIVEGHSDSQGADESNLQLSRQRANAVAAELLAVGIAPSRVEAVGVGEARPVASNDDPIGRARNRRVEIHLSQSGAGLGGPQ